jgi:hypothetical protein
VEKVLEDEHPQDDRGWCAEPPPALTQGMAPSQGGCHEIHQGLVIQRRVDQIARIGAS